MSPPDETSAQGAREGIDRVLQLLSEYLVSGEEARTRYGAFLRANRERQRFILDVLDDHYGDAEQMHLQSLARRQQSTFENIATFVNELIEESDNAAHMGPRAHLFRSAISNVIDLTDPVDVRVTT